MVVSRVMLLLRIHLHLQHQTVLALEGVSHWEAVVPTNQVEGSSNLIEIRIEGSKVLRNKTLILMVDIGWQEDFLTTDRQPQVVGLCNFPFFFLGNFGHCICLQEVKIL